MKSPAPGDRLPMRRGTVEYALGSEADHEAVYQTLLHVFHGPDRETFLASLNEPDYRPDQRIIARVENKLVSHVHLTNREIRYGLVQVPMNGVMWVGTLPEYRGLGLAQNLMRFADRRAEASGAVVQALTTSMPDFYRPFGWGICGNQSLGISLSRNLPAMNDGLMETQDGPWLVRPWRQVELGDLMDLYDAQFATTTGTVVRTEDYWRWLIGRKYAHVIWVACQGEVVRGYAFVKDHRILEIAYHRGYPNALKALLGRVRAEALERAYPQVIVHAPTDHTVLDTFRPAGTIIAAEEHEGNCSMYHIPDPGRFLEAIRPELVRRAIESGASLPVELGIATEKGRWLIHLHRTNSRIEPEKLSRRYLTLSDAALVRLAMGHTGIDRAIEKDGVECSTSTAIDAARILFPSQPIWRSPLDAATA